MTQGNAGVVVVDQLHVVRAGLTRVIDAEPDLVALGHAGDAESALSLIRELPRDNPIVVAVVLGMSGPHESFWLIRAIRSEFPGLTILAMAGNGDPGLVSRALFVGADGYVDKSVSPEEFISALRAAVKGEIVLAGLSDDYDLASIADGVERQVASDVLLTEREREILTLAAEGITARQIGDRLGLHERTVTTHFGRIYSKLGVNSRVAALSAAANAGLVTVSQNH